MGLFLLARPAGGSGCPSHQRGSSSEHIDHSLGGNRGDSDPLLAASVCHVRRRLMLRAYPPWSYCESR